MSEAPPPPSLPLELLAVHTACDAVSALWPPASPDASTLVSHQRVDVNHSCASVLLSHVQVLGGGPDPLVSQLTGGAVRMLAGTSIVRMTASFNRRPLLSGATTSLALSGLSAGNSYPYTGSADAVGLEEFKAAYSAGFAAAVNTSNAWLNRFAIMNRTVLRTEACNINPALYVWPTPTPGGLLSNILNSGKVKAGYNANTRFLSDDGDVLVDTTTSPVSGAALDFFGDIVQAIASHYGVTLTIEWTLPANSDASFTVRELIYGPSSLACWGGGGECVPVFAIAAGLGTRLVLFRVWLVTRR
jgi:hypothetical protein